MRDSLVVPELTLKYRAVPICKVFWCRRGGYLSDKGQRGKPYNSV